MVRDGPMTKKRPSLVPLVIDGGPRLGEWVLVALVLVGPLIVHRGLTDAFALPKLTFAVPLALFSVALLAIGLARGPWLGPSALLREPVVQAVLPLAALASLGLLTSEHSSQVQASLPLIWIGAVCLIGWTLGLEASRLQRLLGLVVWPGAVLAVVAILQFHDLYQPFEFLSGGKTARLRVTSLAGAVSDLAGYLVLPCLLLQFQLYRDRGGRRTIAALLLALSGYALVLTQTLTALAALAAGSLLMWLSILPRRWIGRGLVGLAAGGLIALAAVEPLRDRVVAKLARGVSGDLNFVLSGRLDAWRVASHLLVEHPWTGVGLGAYRAEFAETKLALLDEGVKFYPGHTFPTFTYAHNELLQVGAETGWPGLLALGWALAALLRGLRRLDLEPPRRGLLFGALAAVAVLSLGHFPFHLALTAVPCLLVLAWALRLLREAKTG